MFDFQRSSAMLWQPILHWILCERIDRKVKMSWRATIDSLWLPASQLHPPNNASNICRTWWRWELATAKWWFDQLHCWVVSRFCPTSAYNNKQATRPQDLKQTRTRTTADNYAITVDKLSMKYEDLWWFMGIQAQWKIKSHNHPISTATRNVAARSQFIRLHSPCRNSLQDLVSWVLRGFWISAATSFQDPIDFSCFLGGWHQGENSTGPPRQTALKPQAWWKPTSVNQTAKSNSKQVTARWPNCTISSSRCIARSIEPVEARAEIAMPKPEGALPPMSTSPRSHWKRTIIYAQKEPCDILVRFHHDIKCVLQANLQPANHQRCGNTHLGRKKGKLHKANR